MTQVGGLGTVMGIWAHPDDELYSMAGIFALTSQLGNSTICVTATRGELGVQDETRWPQASLADIRTTEMESAVRLLGIDNHHWLDYPDGGCADVDFDTAVGALTSIIDRYRPDSIFTFGPDGMTGHDDHQTVSAWTTTAVRSLGDNAPRLYYVTMTKDSYEALREADDEFDVFFNIDQPCMCGELDQSLIIELDDSILDLKIQALKAMPSQTEAILTKHEDSVRKSVRTESFLVAKV